MTETKALTPGVQKYIDEAKRLQVERDAHLARVRGWKFDTIAVHGLYSLEESYRNNQGALVEPLYLSSSQSYRDSDELEAALAYLIPT